MSEFEDRLRAELRHEPASPDEAFAIRVSERIARSERLRRIVLAVASLLASALISTMIAGLFAIRPALAALVDAEWQEKAGEPPSWIGWAVPAVALLGFAMLLASARKRRR
jgi:hypothetical protein